MKRLLIIFSLLFCSLFATAQRKTPFFTPPADTAKNKSADTSKYKKAVAVGVAKPDVRVLKKPLLTKVSILNMTNKIEIFYSYDDKDKLTKVEYKSARGLSIKDYLFYDEQKRIYLIVREDIRFPASFITTRCGTTPGRCPISSA